MQNSVEKIYLRFVGCLLPLIIHLQSKIFDQIQPAELLRPSVLQPAGRAAAALPFLGQSHASRRPCVGRPRFPLTQEVMPPQILHAIA